MSMTQTMGRGGRGGQGGNPRRDTPIPGAVRTTGTVKFWAAAKGYGFITVPNGGEDMYAHISAVEGGFVPVEGDEVSFLPGRAPDGRLRALAVRLL